ncbi:MAG: thermonuclease family protein [Blastocatellia bacterium]
MAAVDATQNETFAKEFIRRKILNRQVKVWVTPGKSDESQITGQVWLGKKDLNRIMIKKGFASVIEPPLYSTSSYSLCVYRQLELDAQKKKIGIWAK